MSMGETDLVGAALQIAESLTFGLFPGTTLAQGAQRKELMQERDRVFNQLMKIAAEDADFRRILEEEEPKTYEALLNITREMPGDYAVIALQRVVRDSAKKVADVNGQIAILERDKTRLNEYDARLQSKEMNPALGRPTQPKLEGSYE